MAAAHPRSPDVFISYAGPDRDVASALGARLQRASVSVWWDAHLRADEPFEQQIQRVLAVAQLVVAVLSPRTLTSEWVRWELSQASQNGVHIVPLLVDGARPEDLPPPLHLLPALMLDAADQAMDAVTDAVRRRIETITRSPRKLRDNDARRRLASAAARTARQAADIRQRKASAAALPAIVVRGAGDPDLAVPTANRYAASEGFAAFLRAEGIAVAFTAFQTDELYLLGSSPDGQLVVDVQHFRKPTGLYFGDNTLLLGTLSHVYRLENILRPGQRLDGVYSHCYVPRLGHFTGVVDTHDVALSRSGDVLFVATRYNCLAATSPVHSFRPVWRPPFIGAIVAEDICHLNGVALCDGLPAYATAASMTDRYDGWRDCLHTGGVVLDMRTDSLVCKGLSLPHSPRMIDDRLWVLNSGHGEVGWIDGTGQDAGRFQAVARCPGFTRGLGLHGRFAFVGISRPRYDDATDDVLSCFSADRDGTWCGLQVIDAGCGECVHWFRIDGAVREIYDVAVLPGVDCARTVSPLNDEGLDLITVDMSRSLR